MSNLDQRQAAADNKMTAAFHAIYKRQASGELSCDEVLVELAAAHDEHFVTTKAIRDERNSGGAR